MQPNHERAALHLNDPDKLRAIAHPKRLAILSRLKLEGPGTATDCAKAMGISPAAASYHLRVLASAGLIEEVPQAEDGRKTLWRVTAARLVVSSAAASTGDVDTAGRELLQQLVAREDRLFEDWLENSPQQPQAWQDALTLASETIMVNPDELQFVLETLTRVLAPYAGRLREPEADPDRRRVTILFRAIPQVPNVPEVES